MTGLTLPNPKGEPTPNTLLPLQRSSSRDQSSYQMCEKGFYPTLVNPWELRDTHVLHRSRFFQEHKHQGAHLPSPLSPSDSQLSALRRFKPSIPCFSPRAGLCPVNPHSYVRQEELYLQHIKPGCWKVLLVIRLSAPDTGTYVENTWIAPASKILNHSMWHPLFSPYSVSCTATGFPHMRKQQKA